MDFDLTPEQTWGEQIEDRGSQITFSALGQQAPIEAKRHWDPDFAKRRKMKALLDERIPATTGAELSARGHKVGTQSKWSSGAAPVMIRVTPDGVIEAGADPYGYRTAEAW
jgi:gamma-glutamyltranspeptidase